MSEGEGEGEGERGRERERGILKAYSRQSDESLVEIEGFFHHKLFSARKWNDSVITCHNWRTQFLFRGVTVGMGLDRPLDKPSRVVGSLPKVNAISPSVGKYFLRKTRKVSIDERERRPLSVAQHELPRLASWQATRGRERAIVRV